MNSLISLFAIVFSLVALLVSIAAIVIVLAQKWSTHRIEWKPLETYDPFQESEDEKKNADEDDEKVLEEALNLQRKGKKQKEVDPLSEILETNNF
jgi:biopolymer transport protein ExbB/TolQ